VERGEVSIGETKTKGQKRAKQRKCGVRFFAFLPAYSTLSVFSFLSSFSFTGLGWRAGAL
jgi:hypothetical protein